MLEATSDGEVGAGPTVRSEAEVDANRAEGPSESNADAVAEYEQNMANFIKDVRKDLNVPELPFVIAETGMGGYDEEEVRALALMNSQAAVAKRPECNSTVAFVGTRAFWGAEELSPSSQGYPWKSNAGTYYLIGDAMGQAMAELLKRGKR